MSNDKNFRSQGWFGKKDKKGGAADGKKPSRAEIIAQAHANARKARAEIGEETIQKVAEAFVEEQKKKEHAARLARIEKALRDIKSADKNRVADHLRSMIDDKE